MNDMKAPEWLASFAASARQQLSSVSFALIAADATVRVKRRRLLRRPTVPQPSPQ